MQRLARYTALALLIAGAAAQNSTTKWPQVVGVLPAPKSLEEHHTNGFKLDDGFVVRRGSPFELTVTLDEVMEHSDQAIIMQNGDSKRGAPVPHWTTSLKEKTGTKQYVIEVTTSVDDPIGKYDDISFLVVAIDKEGHYIHTHEAYEYSYPFPIYLLFDPWNPKDEKVYCPDKAILNDTVLNQYGKVFDGSIHDHRTILWYYGHFHEVALEAAFYLLGQADPKIMSDPYETAKFISHNEGMAEVATGIRGNKQGLLHGRWESTFPGGVDPDTWVSSVDILKAWKKNGEPTKYGQCWVFAALQNTLLRTLGFAARQLSCFDARVDNSYQDDPHGIKHHIVREYYDEKAKLQYSYGSVWNYHRDSGLSRRLCSWNDVWLNRKEENCSGWNAIDATPPGLAFASLKAVYDQLDDIPWQTNDFISMVHARVERYLVECEPLPEGETKRKSLDGCKVRGRVGVDKSGVKSMLTSADDASGEKDITKEYVNPDKDAYIPEHRRPQHSEMVYSEAPFHVRLHPTAHRLGMGQPVDVLIAVDYEQSAPGAPALDLVVTMDLVDNYGNIVKEVHSSVQKMLIDREGHGELSVQVSPSDYVHIDMTEKFVEVRALVADPQTGAVVLEKKALVLAGPQLHVMAPPLVSAGSGDVHEVQVHLVNPHDFAVEKACVTAHSSSHAVRLHGDSRHCLPLGPKEGATISKYIISPDEEGSHMITFTTSGDYMPVTAHQVPIVATANRIGLAAHLA